MESWVFLLVGGLGAVGAAMALGTLAALVRFERTGELPGGEQPDADDDVGATGRVRRRLAIRIVLGLVVAGVCFADLARRGLLGGPFAG